MSIKHSPKISFETLWRSLVVFGLVLLAVGNVRVILENALRSKDVDNQIVSEATPRMSRQLVEEASAILKSFSSRELTTQEASASVEQEGQNPQEGIRGKTAAIHNASGTNGAGASVAQALKDEGLIVSDISTAPSLQTGTTVFYRKEATSASQSMKATLDSLGWTVTTLEERQEQTDFFIVLGR